MMALKAGRSALRLVPSYTCTLRHRVDSAPALLQRVASSFSTGARTNQEAVAHETSASPAGTSVHTPKVSTAPKSRPKAHTGRTTSKPRTKKADSTTTPKAAKPKAAAKQPKKTVRVKAKKPAKKVLTEEQKVAKKEEAQKQKARDHIRELKQTALTKPKALPQTAWTLINSEMSKESKSIAGAGAHSDRYNNLSTGERERYNHIAAENATKNKEAYDAWIRSHTPEEIRKANLARAQLRRMKLGPYTKIHDDRQVKGLRLARSLFLKARFESGDMKGISLPEAARQISKDWASLSQGEKQQYLDQEAADKERYVKEMKSTYNIELPMRAKTA